MGDFTVLIDTREKRNDWTFDMYECCTGIERVKLNVGDVTIKGMENLLAIERKRNTNEISLNFTKDKDRFYREMELLKDFKYKYFVCEFSVDDVLQFPKNSGIPVRLWKNIRMNGKYLLSCLYGLQDKYGIELVFCNENFSSEEVVINILKEVYAKETVA